ncbi:MAG: M24 family metallopeptidase [Gaiellales bacterium]
MAEGVMMHSESRAQPDQLAASRFLAGDPFVYLESGGRRLLAVGDFEVGRARRESQADEVWGFGDLGLAELYAEGFDSRTREIELALRAVRRAELDRVLVPGWFPLATAEHLRAHGIAVQIDDAEFERRRRHKDAHAIAAIREITGLVEDSMGLIRRRLAACSVDPDGTLRDDGGVLTSERLHATVRMFWAENGLEGELPIIAGGPHGADAHDVGSGPLLARTPIICDLFPRSARTQFHGDMTRTFCVGEPPEELVELHAIVERALDMSLAAIRPGVRGSSLDTLVCELFEQAGYPTTRSPEGVDPTSIARYIHGLGHGVGLAIHELPSIGRGGNEDLRVGDVVTVEPGLYREGFGGVRIEDMVVLTESGCENLNLLDRSLAVIA